MSTRSKRPSQQELEKKFIIDNRTLFDLATEYQVHYGTIQRWLTSYNIKKFPEKKQKKIVNGYIKLYRPQHPLCDTHKYVPEHRLIMEEHIGRYLEEEEEVHHLDLDRANNNILNLVLFPSKSIHGEMHRYMEKVALYLLGINPTLPQPLIFDKEIFFQKKWTKKIDLLKLANELQYP